MPKNIKVVEKNVDMSNIGLSYEIIKKKLRSTGTMGMSASQARLLSLTARLSDLEFSAQTISNAKLTLATKSQDASEKYLAALDKQKITVRDADTSSVYVDATARNLTTYNAISKLDKQRFLKSASGQVVVSEKTAKAFDSTTSSGSISYYVKNQIGRDTDSDGQDDSFGYANVESFLKDALGYTDKNSASESGLTYNASSLEYYKNVYSGVEDLMNSMGYTSNPENEDSSLAYDSAAMAYCQNTFNEMKECGYTVIETAQLNDSEWLIDQLSSGNLYLSEWDQSADGDVEGTKGNFVNISWQSGDSSLSVVDDEAGIAKAEAEYNVTMADIQNKDKRYDLQLKTIDTEHTAIQTEMDSVKKVIDKNIERTFKIFDA